MVYDMYAAQRAAVAGGGANPFVGLPSSAGRPMPMMTPSGAGTQAPAMTAAQPMGIPQPQMPAIPMGGLDLSFMTPANRAAVEAQLAGRMMGGAIGPQPFGSTGGSPEGTSVAGRGGMGDTSNIGGGVPNTGGMGLSAADAIAGGFGALGPAAGATMGGGYSLGGPIGAESGFNSSPDVTGMTANLGGYAQSDSPLGLSQAAAMSAAADVAAAAQAIGAEAVAAALAAGMSPEAASAIGAGAAAAALGGGGGGGIGGGGVAAEGGGGFGSTADGSSNAGIGGPAGTGAAGGIGAAAGAGAGTGGVGEGEQYGGHFTVGGVPGRPDNMNVNFRATPGEKVVVVPPGQSPGQILQRPEQQSHWQMLGGNPFMGLPRPGQGVPGGSRPGMGGPPGLPPGFRG